jgi:hypothetical protein
MNKKDLIKSLQKKYLRAFFYFLLILLALSLFKNISYPLFWADEGMTVMHGQRVLEYGYPKVHDGKNVLYDLRHPDPTLGIDEKTDAFIGGANWGQYYIAAIGVKLAELSDDIFTKTAIIRILFALIGLAGLAMLALIAEQFFYCGETKTVFLILFTFLELTSVPLVLHMREARYYPLTVFLVAFVVFVYTHYRILNKAKYWGFLTLLTVSLFLLFLTFSPAYFILLAAISIFETSVLAKSLLQSYRAGRHCSLPAAISPPEKPFICWLRGMLPLTLSLIAVAPLISFFRMFYIAEEMAKFDALISKTDGVPMYLTNLSMLWGYAVRSDFICLAIILKLALLILFALKLFNKTLPSFDMPKLVFSYLLTILFIVYFFAIAKIPNFLFTRYFITLQPVLTLIILIDSAVIYNLFSQWRSALTVYCRGALIFLCLGFVFLNISVNMGNIKGHLHEVSHQYKGPLDYIIPFIKEKYASPENLVIATNYEETSFMYYLKAKVIVGFVGNNLEQDAQIIPDVVVYRKTWGNFKKLFSDWLATGHYNRIVFPVVDSPSNNIPELNWAPPFFHRFRTEETTDEGAKLDIFLRM